MKYNFLGDSGVTLVSFRDDFRRFWASLLGHFGMVLEYVWVTFGSLCRHYWVTFGLFCYDFWEICLIMFVIMFVIIFFKRLVFWNLRLNGPKCYFGG